MLKSANVMTMEYPAGAAIVHRHVTLFAYVGDPGFVAMVEPEAEMLAAPEH